MNSKLILTKFGQFWFRRFPTSGNHRFVRNHFRKWCVKDELMASTNEDFQMWVSPSDYSTYQIFFFGQYDSMATRLMKAHVPEAATCWDVGSERGWFTLLMGKLTGPRGRVDAFEAFPLNYSKLKKNISLNKLDWVYAYNVAVSSQIGKMHFVPPSDEVTHNVGFLQDCSGVGYLAKHAPPESIKVSTTTLDQHAEETGIEQLDFIKLDIEGAEVEAIKGAKQVIRKFQPKIFHRV